MTIFDVDPNVVKPGWTPFIITLLLAAVMVVLYRSMRRQFGKIRSLPRESRPGTSPDATRPGPATVSIRPESSEHEADGPADRGTGIR